MNSICVYTRIRLYIKYRCVGKLFLQLLSAIILADRGPGFPKSAGVMIDLQSNERDTLPLSLFKAIVYLKLMYGTLLRFTRI